MAQRVIIPSAPASFTRMRLRTGARWWIRSSVAREKTVPQQFQRSSSLHLHAQGLEGAERRVLEVLGVVLQGASRIVGQLHDVNFLRLLIRAMGGTSARSSPESSFTST